MGRIIGVEFIIAFFIGIIKDVNDVVVIGIDIGVGIGIDIGVGIGCRVGCKQKMARSSL